MQQTEVVIIGAGLAGLYAAVELTKKGIPFLMLESSGRIGGRILGNSVNLTDNKQHDLGPTWIFPHQQKIQKLTRALGLNIFKQYIHGDALFQRSGSTAPEQFSGAGAMELLRIQGGTYAIVDALFKQVNKKQVLTNHPVDSMTLQDGTWQLSVEANPQSKSFSAKHVVLALPPRMIATHLTSERWASPALTDSLRACQTWMSAQAKCVVSYNRPFWRDHKLSGQAFSQVGPMSEMHDASIEENGHYALFGFIGWPLSKRMQYSPNVLKEHCIEQLAWLYGDVARDFNQCEIKDWALDKWIASPFDINEPSQHPNFLLPTFANELETLNLYLAGSEFARIDPGYLEGAIDAVDFSLNKLYPFLQ